jgi:hypothetical protein
MPPFLNRPGALGAFGELRRLFGATTDADTTPVVQLANPTAGRIAGGRPVTLTGLNFGAASGTLPIVNFGGVAATAVVVVSRTTITCITPQQTAAGLVDVTVQCGSQVGTLRNGFTYIAGTITGVAPSFGPLVGATPVMITGFNFVVGCAISFGGNPATGVTFLDSQHYLCTTPTHAIGFVDVVITEP